MVSFLNCLIFYYTLFLYCCGIHKGDKSLSGFNGIRDNLQININRNIKLTDNEYNKFNVLEQGLKKILTQIRFIKEKEIKCKDFFNWLSKNKQKQKELAQAFTTVYKFLDIKRQSKKNNITIAQLIINTLNCYAQNQQNQCKNESYEYVSIQASIEHFFRTILIFMSRQSTKEDMFKYLKNELLEPDKHVAELTGSFGYEEILISKLNYKQKQGLNFLKRALNNEIRIFLFLKSKEDSIKTVLDHIQSEFAKCNKNKKSQNIFKRVVREYFKVLDRRYGTFNNIFSLYMLPGYFNENDNNKLDDFKIKVKSYCGNKKSFMKMGSE